MVGSGQGTLKLINISPLFVLYYVASVEYNPQDSFPLLFILPNNAIFFFQYLNLVE
jgi:hypothetical protein